MKWILLLLAVTDAGASALPCYSCHREQGLHQPMTPMGRAMLRPTDKGVLGDAREFTFREGKYSTTVSRQEGGLHYSVTDGTSTASAAVDSVFGLGHAGQTFVLRMDGKYYESRASYFGRLQGLDFTLGAKNSTPSNVQEAIGRELSPKAAADCFGCHSTRTAQGAVQPGIHCEVCHKGAGDHAASLSAGKPIPMKKLSTMTSEETNEFCGQCHRTWAYIAENGPRGPMNVRFQPYRLTNSKCYDAADRRIACVACHDPHQEVPREANAFDGKCQACHVAGQKNAKLCKVAKENCASCHMPKYELEGAHYAFTDHRIRIARKGAPYPD